MTHSAAIRSFIETWKLDSLLAFNGNLNTTMEIWKTKRHLCSRPLDATVASMRLSPLLAMV